MKINKTEVKEIYEKTHSINQVAKQLNISWDKAKKICLEMGYQSTKKNQHCEFVEYNLFQKIETEADAYWLGFLYSDGWIRSDRNEIGLGVQERDAEILEKFKEYIGTTNNIQIKQKEKIKKHTAPDGHIIEAKQNFHSLTFSCKKTKENLIALGCLPNKSKILHCPTIEQVPDNLLFHFARGVVDGDGSVRWGERKDFVICSASINFLIELTTRMKINNFGVLYKEQFRISKSALVRQVLEKLYKDSSIYLNRKFQVYILSQRSCPL